MRTPEGTLQSIQDNANLATGRLWGEEKIPILELEPEDGTPLIFLKENRRRLGKPMIHIEGDITDKGKVFYRCESLKEAQELAEQIEKIRAGKRDQYDHTA